ncbi:haloacid dehalogenase-like hydrolase [Botryobacter ruber]|uniref:haloacid dehalogenase-like hydrolase n=1 Tax=Botryobacter ruber TaxID=2171629 RepID=UPI000E09F2BB|nr:haloacid dehalogenase-like hydrolase [Botryobacter ruber]
MATEKAQDTGGKNEELQLAVFDLNKTFYHKSSKEEFYKFILTKEPKRLSYIFEMAYFKLLNKLNQIRQTEFKENFFNYLDKLPPDKVEAYAIEFWKKEFPENFNQEIMSRLDSMKKDGVKIVCATGGLEVYVKPLFRLFEVDGMVGTRVKYTNKTYLVKGEACKGEEKLRRLNSLFNGKKYRILEAYSDKKEEMLEKAEKAFLVKKGNLQPME